MKQNLSHLVFILDRSGSMASTVKDAEGGFDATIDKQKDEPGECRVTLVEFSDGVETIFEDRQLHAVEKLKLSPSGSTALRDALGTTIEHVGHKLVTLSEHDRPAKVIFVVITDGGENASRQYGPERIKEMIEHQQSVYGWTFFFLGANQDAVTTGTALGFNVGQTLTFNATERGTIASYDTICRALSSTRSGDTYAFTDADRADAVAQDPATTVKGALPVSTPLTDTRSIRPKR